MSKITNDDLSRFGTESFIAGLYDNSGRQMVNHQRYKSIHRSRMICDTGLVDVLPLRQFALGTFRPQDVSPRGKL